MSKVIAIIPAYNEEESILGTIRDLRENAPDVDLVVVNDGSKDHTAKLVKEAGVSLISLPVNLGLAGGFQAGMKYAVRNDYDYAIQFDADGQHSAEYIAKMIEEAENSHYNVVIGSRFVSAKKHFSARMAGSVLLTAIIRLTTGKAINDPTSGMRLFDKETMALMANGMDFGPEPDTMALFARWGYSVGEIQVEMRERQAGESYLNLTKSVSYMLHMCLSILLIQWFRKKG